MNPANRTDAATPLEKFRELTKRVVSVPKSEIDRRAKEHKEERDAAKSDEAAE